MAALRWRQAATRTPVRKFNVHDFHAPMSLRERELRIAYARIHYQQGQTFINLERGLLYNEHPKGMGGGSR